MSILDDIESGKLSLIVIDNVNHTDEGKTIFNDVAGDDLLYRAKLGEAALKDYKQYIKNDCEGQFQSTWCGCTKGGCGHYYLCEKLRAEAGEQK
jgi:hypothetical protein